MSSIKQDGDQQHSHRGEDPATEPVTDPVTDPVTAMAIYQLANSECQGKQKFLYLAPVWAALVA